MATERPKARHWPGTRRDPYLTAYSWTDESSPRPGRRRRRQNAPLPGHGPDARHGRRVATPGPGPRRRSRPRPRSREDVQDLGEYEGVAAGPPQRPPPPHHPPAAADSIGEVRQPLSEHITHRPPSPIVLNELAQPPPPPLPPPPELQTRQRAELDATTAPRRPIVHSPPGRTPTYHPFPALRNVDDGRILGGEAHGPLNPVRLNELPEERSRKVGSRPSSTASKRSSRHSLARSNSSARLSQRQPSARRGPFPNATGASSKRRPAVDERQQLLQVSHFCKCL